MGIESAMMEEMGVLKDVVCVARWVTGRCNLAVYGCWRSCPFPNTQHCHTLIQTCQPAHIQTEKSQVNLEYYGCQPSLTKRSQDYVLYVNIAAV